MRQVRFQADGGGEIIHRLLVFALAEPHHAPLVEHPGVPGGQPGGPVEVGDGLGELAFLGQAVPPFLAGLGVPGVTLAWPG